MQKVLIIGGVGRIGGSIATDILSHTAADVIIAGRTPETGEIASQRLGPRAKFTILDISQQSALVAAIAQADLVVHAAGPFRYRDATVLKTCITGRVNYIDVSDEPSFTEKALALNADAKKAGITAIINTGVFPGISNCLVKQGIETFDQTDSVRLSYVVAGSGGAGITVMRTTFVGLQHPFKAWLDGGWQTVEPYSDRETVEFPAPYGTAHVYWYDMPEAMTLQQSFPVKTVVTKFGVVPDFYNHATWAMARALPPAVLQNPSTVEFLARLSYGMTRVTDRFTGIGVAMRCDVAGKRAGRDAHYARSFVHKSAAVAAGAAAGSIVESLLGGELKQSGVYSPEQIISTELFIEMMASRGLTIQNIESLEIA